MKTSSEHKCFSKEMGLPQQRERVTVNNLYNIGQNNYYKPVEKSTDTGIINTGAISGALNPYSKEANKHAKQSWQKLISGEFEEKDVVLLKHEYAELRHMEKGLSQDKSHIKASKRYNYAKYCD